MRVHKRIRYNYFRSIPLFFLKRAHVWNLSLCKSFMSYDTCKKPERDSAKHRCKLIECVQV